jgi:hypothetical protein
MDTGNGIETSTPHLLLPQVAVAPSQNELKRRRTALKLWALLLLIGLLPKAPHLVRAFSCLYFLPTTQQFYRVDSRRLEPLILC